MTRYIISVAVTLGFGIVLGFRISTNPLALLAACGLVLLFALAMCWISALIGLLVKTPQGVQTFGFTAMFPIVFASGLLVPITTMPGWLQAFAKANPDDPARGRVPGSDDRWPGGGASRGVVAVGPRHRGGLRPARSPGISSQDVTEFADTPDLVQRAVEAARQIGFPVHRDDPGHGRGSASLPGTGRFLAMLAAGCHGGRIGELGTGTGIGTAWISGAMPADCTLVTAELDPDRAAAAARVLAGDSQGHGAGRRRGQPHRGARPVRPDLR